MEILENTATMCKHLNKNKSKEPILSVNDYIVEWVYIYIHIYIYICTQEKERDEMRRLVQFPSDYKKVDEDS